MREPYQLQNNVAAYTEQLKAFAVCGKTLSPIGTNDCEKDGKMIDLAQRRL